MLGGHLSRSSLYYQGSWAYLTPGLATGLEKSFSLVYSQSNSTDKMGRLYSTQHASDHIDVHPHPGQHLALEHGVGCGSGSGLLSLMVDSSEHVPIAEATRHACYEREHGVGLLFWDIELSITSSCSHSLLNSSISLKRFSVYSFMKPTTEAWKLVWGGGGCGFAFYVAQTDLNRIMHFYLM